LQEMGNGSKLLKIRKWQRLESSLAKINKSC
jgi:hypothetical protein